MDSGLEKSIQHWEDFWDPSDSWGAQHFLNVTPRYFLNWTVARQARRDNARKLHDELRKCRSATYATIKTRLSAARWAPRRTGVTFYVLSLENGQQPVLADTPIGQLIFDLDYLTWFIWIFCDFIITFAFEFYSLRLLSLFAVKIFPSLF